MVTKSGVERYLDVLWRHEIERVNDHLPKSARTLRDLLMMENPTIETRGGGEYPFSRKDLLLMAKEVPEEYHGSIRLPIILLRRLELGRGTFTVSGGKLEHLLVARLLGMTDKPLSRDLEMGNEFYVYRPQVASLVRKYRTIFTIGFT